MVASLYDQFLNRNPLTDIGARTAPMAGPQDQSPAASLPPVAGLPGGMTSPYLPPGMEGLLPTGLGYGMTPDLLGTGMDGGVAAPTEPEPVTVPKPFSKKMYGGLFDQNFAVRANAQQRFQPDPTAPARTPMQGIPSLDPVYGYGQSAPAGAPTGDTPQGPYQRTPESPAQRSMREKLPRSYAVMQLINEQRQANQASRLMGMSGGQGGQGGRGGIGGRGGMGGRGGGGGGGRGLAARFFAGRR